ncbi:aminoglycoside phosphotransferase family protein [Mobilitalea sibirica]|uniref:Aminoglycoside phosphotransferase family protein n=1 Tax=Mobilitalea sibirica TaxID=1462919 RepID=A0A8J7KVA2_9FIRM|nr:aminoglycoside phosphotransferase family protein [Mobilitalea sibirica]MBH1939910.1 aminoglycoside phosphotransferase family protein [Mobilitalea sibirica]
MRSITKRVLNDNQIRQLVAAGFGEQIEVREVKELTDGYFNNSYLIEFSNRRKVVLKVAPKDDVQVLTYEKNLMSIEVVVLDKLSKVGIPVPDILFHDNSRLIIDGEYFFMSYLPGVPMNKVKEKITKSQLDMISSTLGQYARKIGKIDSNYFGVIGNDRRQFQSWYSCFKKMIMDLMDDANRIHMALPIKKNEAMSMIDKYKEVLDMIKTPTLVHKDLWEGNIFLDENSYEITGVIDCERAIYAEPLMEAVCGFLDDNEKFMISFYGRSNLDKNERIRVKLYKLYLFLLLVVECPYRQYEDKGIEKWARDMLQNVVLELIYKDQNKL